MAPATYLCVNILYPKPIYLFNMQKHQQLHYKLHYECWIKYFAIVIVIVIVSNETYIAHLTIMYSRGIGATSGHQDSLSQLYIITRTSEWVIILWRSCELFLCRNIL